MSAATVRRCDPASPVGLAVQPAAMLVWTPVLEPVHAEVENRVSL